MTSLRVKFTLQLQEAQRIWQYFTGFLNQCTNFAKVEKQPSH